MRVLAVGCHPDDLEIGCGGTLNRYVVEGAEVHMCHVANGNLGHVEIMPAELRDIRTEEAERAGRTLGATRVHNLDVGDTYVHEYDEQVVDGLVEIIRSVDPDVIITHSDQDYMRDHIQVGNLTFNASFVASVVHRATLSPATGIAPIFSMDTLAGMGFEPTHYVDITTTIETKLAALACHESQIKWMAEHDHIDFLDFVRTCSKYRGYQSGVAYAEGFRPWLRWPRVSTRHLLP